MRIEVEYGRSRASLEISKEAVITSSAAAVLSALPDPAAAMRHALDHPLDYPPLRRALTPDDHIAILVDERLPQLPALLIPLLEHIVSTGIPAEAITLVCQPPSSGQPWLEQLPEALEEVRCEIHDPHDRKRLSYLTTARNGKPLYFNRTAVDAAQLVVLSGQRYDPLLGHGGGTGAIYPVFSDEATRSMVCERLTMDTPGETPWVTETEANEAAWLLGAPFFVQVIEGPGDGVAEVITGSVTALNAARTRHDALWRRTVPRLAETVIAAVSGDPARQSFADLADALTNAARAVQQSGIIVILSEANFAATAVTALLREARDPAAALKEFDRRQALELSAAWQWATAAQKARVCVLSQLDRKTIEEMFATPLDNLEQVQRLANMSEACLILGDANKTLAMV